MDSVKTTWRKCSTDFTNFWYGSHYEQTKKPSEIVASQKKYKLLLFKYTTNDGYINSVYRLVLKSDYKSTLSNEKQMRKRRFDFSD